tara:strand:+ start:6610 stop:7233 length:624 start_codon:yes stop_codon:yes gene_type:complete
MNKLVNDNGVLLYNGQELGLRGGKPLIYGSLLLPTDEEPEAFFTFLFQVPRKFTLPDGSKQKGIPSYYLLDELSARLEGFETKLKAFREKYFIWACMVEDHDRFAGRILKDAGFSRFIVPTEEAKKDNVRITLEKWFDAKNEEGKPVFNVTENCKEFLGENEKAKKAVRNLLIQFEKFARESTMPGNLSESAQRRLDQINTFRQANP